MTKTLHGRRLLLDTHAFLWFLLDDPQYARRNRS
jgi:PIN domain nuclease of toxin-antitoxin system